MFGIGEAWAGGRWRFEVVDGTPRLEATYRLRHQVFCVERGFLAAEDHPSGLETDVYDASAVHIGALGNNALHGTVRLVYGSSLGFPLQRHCELEPDYLAMLQTERAQRRVAEVSRLSVSRNYGRESNLRAPALDRTSLVLGLYVALYRISQEAGLRYWVMAMDDRLKTCLESMGMPFVAMGPVADYYGPVRPYLLSIHGLEESVGRVAPNLLKELSVQQRDASAHAASSGATPGTCPQGLLAVAAANARRRADDSVAFRCG